MKHTINFKIIKPSTNASLGKARMHSVFKQTIKRLRYCVESRMHKQERHSALKQHGTTHYVNGTITLILFHTKQWNKIFLSFIALIVLLLLLFKKNFFSLTAYIQSFLCEFVSVYLH